MFNIQISFISKITRAQYIPSCNTATNKTLLNQINILMYNNQTTTS